MAATTCWDPDARETVHKAHKSVGNVWTEKQGTAVITWDRWVCQCGEHHLDVRKSVH